MNLLWNEQRLKKNLSIPGYEDVKAGIVHWPLSVIRIQCKDEKRLIDLADLYFEKMAWIHG